ALPQARGEPRARGGRDPQGGQGQPLHGVHVARHSGRLLVPAQVRAALRAGHALHERPLPRAGRRFGAPPMTRATRQPTPPGGWHPATDPRIERRPLGSLLPPLRALLTAGGKWGRKRTGTDEVPSVFLLLLHHPRLFWPWMRFAARLMPYGTLDRR